MLYTGFDIGGTKCAVSLAEVCDNDIRIISKRIIKTDHKASPYTIIDNMCDVASEIGWGQKIGISYGGPLDGLSTSGNSKNIVNAFDVAKSIGLKTIALTGKNESALSLISNVTTRVPENETYKVQEPHLPIYHYLCAKIEKVFFTY